MEINGDKRYIKLSQEYSFLHKMNMSLGFYFNTKHMCIVIVNNVKLQESSWKIQMCFFKIGWHPFCEFYLLPL